VYGIVATSSRQGGIFRYFKHSSEAAGGVGWGGGCRDYVSVNLSTNKELLSCESLK
jgi:hypothetical protein